jgi:hypothetical protein
MIKNLALLAGILLSISCEEQITDKYTQYKVQGVDRHGNNRVCFNDPDRICPAIAHIDEEDFARSCKDAGNRVHSCGCNEYVCEQKTFEGIDIEGNIRSCTEISAAVACTMEFTDGDQYAIDCENDGGTPVQCGCHDYICHYPGLVTDPEEPKDPDLITEYLGTNQDGVVRSCDPQQDVVCPVVITRAHVYAQNCKEEGYDTAWCSCSEVLCLDQ